MIFFWLIGVRVLYSSLESNGGVMSLRANFPLEFFSFLVFFFFPNFVCLDFYSFCVLSFSPSGSLPDF